eukprot:1158116-Pelagomonas_calceolata.AAC.9
MEGLQAPIGSTRHARGAGRRGSPGPEAVLPVGSKKRELWAKRKKERKGKEKSKSVCSLHTRQLWREKSANASVASPRFGRERRSTGGLGRQTLQACLNKLSMDKHDLKQGIQTQPCKHGRHRCTKMGLPARWAARKEACMAAPAREGRAAEGHDEISLPTRWGGRKGRLPYLHLPERAG